MIIDIETYQSGFSERSRIFWIVKSYNILSVSEALEIQERKGKNGFIYGFFDFKCEEIIEGLWQSTWSCSASCG
jgi:hypothetical protein